MGRRGKSGKSGSDFKSRIANLGEAFNKAKEDAGSGFVDIPPGTYQFQLVGAEVRESQNDWLHVAFTLACIVEGSEYLGETYVHRCGIEKEESLVFLVRDLQRFGVETDDVQIDAIEDLEEVLGELAEAMPCIRGKLVENGEYVNLRIQKLLDLDESDIPEYELRDGTEFPGGKSEEKGKGKGQKKKTAKKEPEPEPDDDAIGVGDRVSADYDGDAYEGVVDKIEDGTASITFDDGDADDFAVDDLTLVSKGASGGGDTGGEDAELKVGMSVAFEYRGKELEGIVEKIDEAKSLAHVKVEGRARASVVAFDKIEILAD